MIICLELGQRKNKSAAILAQFPNRARNFSNRVKKLLVLFPSLFQIDLLYSTLENLTIFGVYFVSTEPETSINSAPDLYVNKGSTINLTCLVRYAPEPPPKMTWSHDTEVRNCTNHNHISLAQLYLLLGTSITVCSIQKLTLNLRKKRRGGGQKGILWYTRR